MTRAEERGAYSIAPDYPKLRARALCICCNKSKPAGLLVCWTCYSEHDARNGGLERFKGTMDTLEAALP